MSSFLFEVEASLGMGNLCVYFFFSFGGVRVCVCFKYVCGIGNLCWFFILSELGFPFFFFFFFWPTLLSDRPTPFPSASIPERLIPVYLKNRLP